MSGEANAILAAVWLLNSAFEALQRGGAWRDRLRTQLTARLAAAVGEQGLIGGQVVDLASTARRLDLAQLEFIHSHKTGALFIAAAEMGALVAGARPAEIESLHRYAKNLGLAFQITDDLLDYSGDPATMGKDAGQDRERTTFVNLCGIEGARRLVDELVDAALGSLERFGRRADGLRALLCRLPVAAWVAGLVAGAVGGAGVVTSACVARGAAWAQVGGMVGVSACGDWDDVVYGCCYPGAVGALDGAASVAGVEGSGGGYATIVRCAASLPSV